MARNIWDSSVLLTSFILGVTELYFTALLTACTLGVTELYCTVLGYRYGVGEKGTVALGWDDGTKLFSYFD